MSVSTEVSTRGRRRTGHATPRQREILRYVAGGYTSDDMAAILGMSPNTARTHIQDLLFCYHVHSKAAAVAMALALGDLELDDVKWKRA